LRFGGAVRALIADAQLQDVEGSIAVEPFMRGEAVLMLAAAAIPPAALLIPRRAPLAAALFTAAASMPGAEVFMLAVAPWQGEAALLAEGAWRPAGAA
jgi:hypothetical protein